MSRIVFLLEEYSMKILLEGLLPRFFPGLPFLCVPHEGKQDLEKSIPRKLRAWNEPDARFIIVRDNDGGDCRALKQRLVELCGQRNKPDAIVRLACQELEAWYFGDVEALAEAFENSALRHLAAKAQYRDPDAIVQPARSLEKLVPEFQKVSGARRMAKALRRDGSTSGSFRMFVAAVERAAATLGASNLQSAES